MQLIFITLVSFVYLAEGQDNNFRKQIPDLKELPNPGADRLKFQRQPGPNDINLVQPVDNAIPRQNALQGGIGAGVQAGLHQAMEGVKKAAGRTAGIVDRIASTPQCSEDYLKMCSDVSRMNNFAVLECLQNANKETRVQLSPGCNNYLWNYKKNVTEDKRFKEAAKSVCRNELETCEGITFGAELLSCLIEKSDDIRDTHCRQFVNRMEVITFSDYRLLKDFYSKCSASVEKTGCGDVGVAANQEEYGHLQGNTIQCLQKSLNKVDKDCKGALLRVSELSADDYHKDRALFFACREDRERFCEKVAAGEGRVYKCLMDHKKDKHMSDNCYSALTTRQRVIAKDVKVDKTLIKNCKQEIKKSKCLQSSSATVEATLSHLLLCLEDSGFELSGECESELFDIRKSLMEDYKVNPEIVTECAEDIEENCNGLRREGKTLHCLMQRAMKHSLTEGCKTAVRDLLREVKAGNDYRLDPYLAKACEKSIGALCSKLKAGNAKVLSCLMDNIDSELMDEKCASNLYELQYFISRDIKLDPNLVHSCQSDLNKYCGDIDGRERPGEQFHCLHNHLHNKGESLAPECATQLHRALRQRANSVSLNPSIEKRCREDLGRLCTNEEEFKCLQEKYKDLTENCKEVMGPFIQEESEDVRMNKALMKACSPMLKRYCQEALRKKVDEGDALDCLISHKNNPDMDPKCTAGIEHFQIVLLTDFTLTYKFKQACREDVTNLCQEEMKQSKSKNAILTCLSKKIRDRILTDEAPVVTEACRAQVKFEMLQESEDIKLEPDLYRACKPDIDKWCSTMTDTNAGTLECLRKRDIKLSGDCYKKLFNKEQELEEKPDWDFHLMRVCEKVIKTACKNVKGPIIECLQAQLHEPQLDQQCRDAINVRLIEVGRDFRLNPTLKRVCFLDMGKYCNAIRQKAITDKLMDLQGGMMNCLQEHLYKDENKLSPLCEKYIRHFTMETALNFELDPQLKKACGTIAKKQCQDAFTQPGEGLVLECLKDLYAKGELTDPQCKKQVVKFTQEGLADVNVDPLLAEACQLDLKHYCHGVKMGQGQQMACLLEALEDSSVRLQKNCQSMLEQRKELWEYAAEVAPPETLGELYHQINHSPSKHHFLMSFLSFMAGVLFFGICCGRATKRMPATVKNK